MIKAFLQPTDCKLCYWGRMGLLGALCVGVGKELDSYWAALPFGIVAVLATGAKWLVNRYPPQ